MMLLLLQIIIAPDKLVISGSKNGISLAVEKAIELGARRALEIPVGGAFHSPFMEPAVSMFRDAICNITFRDASIPLYQNVDATPYTSGIQIKENLIKQVTSAVLWTQSMKRMINDGHNTFIEVGGRGKILMGMNAKDFTRS